MALPNNIRLCYGMFLRRLFGVGLLLQGNRGVLNRDFRGRRSQPRKNFRLAIARHDSPTDLILPWNMSPSSAEMKINSLVVAVWRVTAAAEANEYSRM